MNCKYKNELKIPLNVFAKSKSESVTDPTPDEIKSTTT